MLIKFPVDPEVVYEALRGAIALPDGLDSNYNPVSNLATLWFENRADDETIEVVLVVSTEEEE